ncbi:MAG: hypothetical protein ABJC36_00735 [Gemmatimonadales bacterium]
MTHPAAVFVPLALSLGLAADACGNPTDPNTERVVGRIDPSLSVRPVVATPQEVRAGVSFTITVTTIGFACASAEGGAVEIRGDLARIVPFDRVPGPGHDTLSVASGSSRCFPAISGSRSPAPGRLVSV